MERRSNNPLSVQERLDTLHIALFNLETGVGAQLQHADTPTALAAYKRLNKSIQASIRHARARQIRTEAGRGA